MDCLDRYGNNVTNFIFNEDGTVTGYSVLTTDVNENPQTQYGNDYSQSDSYPLSKECCNALGFSFNEINQQCYYKQTCNYSEEKNSEAFNLINEKKDRILVLKQQLLTTEGLDRLPLLDEIKDLEFEIDLLKKDLKPNDIKLIFGANNNSPVVFNVNENSNNVLDCVLNVEFDYLWNFDCETLLNCAAGDNSILYRLEQELNLYSEQKTLINNEIQTYTDREAYLSYEIIVNQQQLRDKEALLELNYIDPSEKIVIEQEIGVIRNTLISLTNELEETNLKLGELDLLLKEKELIYNKILSQISVAQQTGDLLGVLSNVVFYLTIEKQVPIINPDNSTSMIGYEWETVYEEEFFRVNDIVEHIKQNSKTGIYFSGDRCDETIENISILLGRECDILSDNTFNSSWLHLSKTISDMNVINKIKNQLITFGVRISYDNNICEHCLLIDKIELNQVCEKTEKIDIIVSKCPGFELQRVVDNKKSWTYSATTHTNNFDLEDRETNYSTIHSKGIINSKEIDLGVDPASAIELDVFNYTQENMCVLSGTSGTTNYLELLTTDIDTIETSDEFKKILTTELIDVKSRKILGGYPTLKDIYERYSNSCGNNSNAFCYGEMNKFGKLLGTYWVDLIEQVIPATTIWGSVYTYRNSVFDNNKYKYKRYSLKYCNRTTQPFCNTSVIAFKNSGVDITIEDISKEGQSIVVNTSLTGIEELDVEQRVVQQNVNSNIQILGIESRLVNGIITNEEYPSCYVSNTTKNNCSIIEALDYSDEAEYYGTVITIQPEYSEAVGLTEFITVK